MEMGVRRAEAAGGLGTRSGDGARQHPAPLAPEVESQRLLLPPHPSPGTGTTPPLPSLSRAGLGPQKA